MQGQPPVTPPRRLLVVVNPATRRDPEAILALIHRERPPGLDLTVRVTPGPGTAAEITRAALDGKDTVVAVGGDGTVREVAGVLRGTGIPLGIIPAGSTNIVARELNIPADPAAALRLILGAHGLAPLDVGVCGERCFLHMAGAGFDSRLFAGANPRLKRRLGWVAYLGPAAQSLLHSSVRFSIVADGEASEVESPLVLVANGGSIIWPRLRLYPGLRKDDGWLDVLIFTATRPVPMLRTLGHVAAMRLDQSPFVLHRRARRVEIATDPPIPFQLDGDVVGTTPAILALDPAALSVIVGGGRPGDGERGRHDGGGPVSRRLLGRERAPRLGTSAPGSGRR